MTYLYTLPYRLLPAVTGDWFYTQLDDKYKNDVKSVHGSDVVRTSIRRAQVQGGGMCKILSSTNSPALSYAIHLMTNSGVEVSACRYVTFHLSRYFCPVLCLYWSSLYSFDSFALPLACLVTQ